MVCAKCKKFTATYTVEGGICETCWVNWMAENQEGDEFKLTEEEVQQYKDELWEIIEGEKLK